MISRRALLKSIILGAAIAFPVARLRVVEAESVEESEPILVAIGNWDACFMGAPVRDKNFNGVAVFQVPSRGAVRIGLPPKFWDNIRG